MCGAAAMPVKAPPTFQVQVAGKPLRHTHELQVYRHLYFCKACGRVAGLRVMHLGAQCDPIPISTTGERNLRRLREGLRQYGTPFGQVRSH